MPHGIDWQEKLETKEALNASSNELKNVFLKGLNVVKSNPNKGILKPIWDDILMGVRLNHNGIEKDKFLITNTVPYFESVVRSFGLEDKIKVEIHSNKEIWFRGAVIREPIPNPDGSGNHLPALRYEDFIDEIQRLRLAHIPVYFSVS